MNKQSLSCIYRQLCLIFTAHHFTWFLPPVTLNSVTVFNFMFSLRPTSSESVKQRAGLFYLQPDRCCVPGSPLWFSSTALDSSTMEAMLVRILTVRELQGEDGRGLDQQRLKWHMTRFCWTLKSNLTLKICKLFKSFREIHSIRQKYRNYTYN